MEGDKTRMLFSQSSVDFCEGESANLVEFWNVAVHG